MDNQLSFWTTALPLALAIYIILWSINEAIKRRRNDREQEYDPFRYTHHHHCGDYEIECTHPPKREIDVNSKPALAAAAELVAKPIRVRSRISMKFRLCNKCSKSICTGHKYFPVTAVSDGIKNVSFCESCFSELADQFNDDGTLYA